MPQWPTASGSTIPSATPCCRIWQPTFGPKPECRTSSGTAPLNLVYVAHGDRMQDISPEERRLYASVDTGFIGQNVYLFCASEGLATVFRGAVDYKKLAQAMRLDEAQFVTFAQTVGYPKA